MAASSAKQSLIPPLRVLDLTDVKGHFCGKILAEMGADVVKIEPPGGDPARDLPPFIDDIPDRNRSLQWFAFNAGKRGITLNLESPDGRDLFFRLFDKADIVLESHRPGYLAGLGLGYEELSKVKPDVIMTSITPFGQEGPYADFEVSDIVLMAMGGFMSENGYPDSPPIRMSVDQAYTHGGAYGAATTMTAYYNRTMTGEGQHIDVSIQECLMIMVDPPVQHWVMEGKQGTNRVGPKMRRGDAQMRLAWPCKDGHAMWRLFTGQPVGRRTHRIIEWAEEDGQETGLMGTKWVEIDQATLTQPQVDEWDVVFHEFFKRHTKAQLVEGAIKRGLMLYPVNTIPEVVQDGHLQDREYFIDVEHPELGRTFKYPGGYWKCPTAPLRHKGRAPLIGEHNAEIYGGELGLSSDRLSALMAAGVI